MESFQLAFHLNRVINIGLKRSENDMMFYDKDGEPANFPFFLFDNEKEDIRFTLIENKVSIKRHNSDKITLDLFASLPSLINTEEKYLIPEESSIDYFFKIETDLFESSDFDHLIPLIKEIPKIVTVRHIDYEGLKNKNNLIF